MLIRLALETKSHHASADADRLTLLEDDVPTAERYRTFLETVYGFEASYERALIQTPGLEPRLVRECSRLVLLERDLRALGTTNLDALPRPVIAAFRDEAHALGWIYAVERNTLLHGLVRRHLWRALPSTLDRAGSYLGAYPTPGARYRELGVDLEAGARRAIPSQIVEGANAAFACQRLWFMRTRAVAARRLAS
jgi:heme oxygenase